MPQKPVTPVVRSPQLGIFSLFAGIVYPLRALGLFAKHPQLRGYVLLPILVNVIVGLTVYAGLLWAGLGLIDLIFSQLPSWIPDISHWDPVLPTWFRLPQVSVPLWLTNWHLPAWLHLPVWNLTRPTWLHLPEFHWSLPTWFQFPSWQFPNWQFPNWQVQVPAWVKELPSAGAIAFLSIIRAALVFTLFLVTGFIFLQFGVLLGAPWYGKLSEEIEKLQMGSVKVVEVGLVQDISRAILYELKKLLLTVGIGLPLLLLQFFPGIGTLVSTVGGIALAATIVCMDFFDATIERRRPTFRQKLGIVWRSLPASASFALVCLGMVSIPLINLLGIPLCVAAGTLFVCDRVLPKLEEG